MKLSDALSDLIFYRHFSNVPYTMAVDTITKVSNRLTAQRTFLIGLLAGAVGYGLVLTWVASELVHENQALTLELNATQTALHITKSPYFIQHSPHCSDSWVLK